MMELEYFGVNSIDVAYRVEDPKVVVVAGTDGDSYFSLPKPDGEAHTAMLVGQPNETTLRLGWTPGSATPYTAGGSTWQDDSYRAR